MTRSIDPDKVVGVILAGGRSRRMGGSDKALLPLAGKPMLLHVVDRFQPQVGSLVLNANGDPARFAPFGLPVVPDTGSEEFPGPLAGILAGMVWATRNRPHTRYVASVPADTPLIPEDLIARLSERLENDSAAAIAATGEKSHPVVGLWPLTLRTSLEIALDEGRRKVLTFAETHGARRVEFPAAEVRGRRVDAFFNANTPEEFAELEALLAG